MGFLIVSFVLSPVSPVLAQVDRHSSPAANPVPNAQAGQTMATGTIFYSAFVAPGTYATTSYEGPMGSYVWEARVVDAEGNASPWQKFGSNTGPDFVLSPIAFIYPSTATTTPQFKHWFLNAKHVIPSHSYKLQVNWGHTQPNQATSSITTSGTALLAGVSVPKTTYSVDYSDTGKPVAIVAEASLYDITGGNTLIAKSSINFFEKTIPAAANCDGSEIQCISYTYDANGNITKIVDKSANSAAKTVDYVYDPLNRLVSASSSNAANGKDYRHTYSYDAIGNITKSDRGTYSYDGNRGESYANPHAVTSITNGSSTTSFTYDKNGNLTTAGDKTYAYNSKNQLIASTNGSSTSSYAYDAFGQRVKLVENGITTIFVNPGYSVTGSTTLKHLFANGEVVATVTNNGTSSVTHYVHTDHLGGTNVVTDEAGNVVETMDYDPFGAPRTDTKVGGYPGERRKYIGQEYDDSTGLSYLNARYYDSARGQFISQDPVFQALGSPAAEQLAQRKLRDILSNPQQLNSYSYALNNPVSLKDPSGLITKNAAALAPLLSQLVDSLSRLLILVRGGGSVGNPAPASTVMLARSTTIEPGPLNITSNNQGSYGNIINQIKGSDDFEKYVEGQINKNAKSGSIDIPADDSSYSFGFRAGSGDLHTALGKVNAGISGARSSDGTWNLRVNITDTYNFELNRDYGSALSERALTTLNNSALLGQTLGVVSNYPVSINFDYTYTPR